MAETKPVSWNQIAVEAIAIVASILLAFAIDAWWDRQKERFEEHEILLGLEVEFIDLKERLDYWAEENRKGIAFVEQFLSDSIHQMDQKSAESAFLYSSMVNVLDQGGAVDALLASGRLEKISDAEIRRRILKWPDWLDDIHTNDVSARNYAMFEIVPYLSRHGFPHTPCPKENMYVCSNADPMPAAYLTLAEDEEFRAMLINRRVWMLVTVKDYELASQQADQTLGMIRQRLETLE